MSGVALSDTCLRTDTMRPMGTVEARVPARSPRENEMLPPMPTARPVDGFEETSGTSAKVTPGFSAAG